MGSVIEGDDILVEMNVRALVRDRLGRIQRIIRKHNLVVTDGLALLTQLIQGNGEAVTHMAVGSDSTAPALSDSGLYAEFYRNTLTSTSRDGSGGATFTLYIGTNDANGNTIREAGLFNAPDGGTMLSRVDFTSTEEVAKDSTISVEIAWDLSFSNA